MGLLPSLLLQGTLLRSAYTISIHVHCGQCPPASQFPINPVCRGRWRRADDFGKGFGTSAQVYTGSPFSRHRVISFPRWSLSHQKVLPLWALPILFPSQRPDHVSGPVSVRAGLCGAPPGRTWEDLAGPLESFLYAWGPSTSPTRNIDSCFPGPGRIDRWPPCETNFGLAPG